MRDALSALKKEYPRLSPAETRIADFILTNPARSCEMSVHELANNVSVSPSTIVRLSKSLGYSGFTQLKLGLVIAGQTYNKILPQVTIMDSVSDIVRKVFLSGISTLKDTLQILEMKKIEEIVDLLTQANSIHFYGVGTSATICEDAYYRFMRIGLPAFFGIDSHIMRISAAKLKKGDIAIGISHCGGTFDTVDTLKIAKEHGAMTIAITSIRKSPICEVADIPIVISSDESQYPMEAISARIGHMAILDALCVALMVRNYDRSKEQIDEMNHIFEKLRKNN